MINEDYNSFQLKITVSVLNKFRKCREILQQEAKQGMKVMNAYVFEQALDAFLSGKKTK